MTWVLTCREWPWCEKKPTGENFWSHVYEIFAPPGEVVPSVFQPQDDSHEDLYNTSPTSSTRIFRYKYHKLLSMLLSTLKSPSLQKLAVGVGQDSETSAAIDGATPKAQYAGRKDAVPQAARFAVPFWAGTRCSFQAISTSRLVPFINKRHGLFQFWEAQSRWLFPIWGFWSSDRWSQQLKSPTTGSPLDQSSCKR